MKPPPPQQNQGPRFQPSEEGTLGEQNCNQKGGGEGESHHLASGGGQRQEWPGREGRGAGGRLTGSRITAPPPFSAPFQVNLPDEIAKLKSVVIQPRKQEHFNPYTAQEDPDWEGRQTPPLQQANRNDGTKSRKGP